MDGLVVGQKVALTKAMMNESVGSIGFVYEEYQDFDNPQGTGVSIIFQNGSYDGFSVEEQKLFLEILPVDQRYTMYDFKNVNILMRDYENGYWKFS